MQVNQKIDIEEALWQIRRIEKESLNTSSGTSYKLLSCQLSNKPKKSDLKISLLAHLLKKKKERMLWLGLAKAHNKQQTMLSLGPLNPFQC